MGAPLRLHETLPAELDAESRAQELLESMLDQAGAPLRAQTELALIMEELFVNVAHYAYPEGGGAVDVTVSADASGGRAEIVLSDAGVPFDPFSRPDPERAESAEDLSIGGLGIVMVRKLATSFSYERQGRKNVVRVTKEWEAPEATSREASVDGGAL